MTAKEILKSLSDIECDLYYSIDMEDYNGADAEAVKNFYNKIDEMLNEWHDITGETL